MRVRIRRLFERFVSCCKKAKDLKGQDGVKTFGQTLCIVDDIYLKSDT
jgi:hypothetical protein